MIANWATISSISLYFLVGVSFEYARILSEEDEIDIKPLNAVQISLFSFLMLLPQLEIIDGVFQLVSNPDAGTLNGLTTTTGTLSRFGATLLFVTFIVSWYSTRIYAICVQKHIVIKLPDVVPAGVANSFTSLCTALLTYLEFQIGLIPPLTVSSPWCSPAPLGAFLGSAGSWTAVLCSLVNIAVSGLLWFPFFKRYDNKLYAEEQEKLAEEKAAAAAK